MTDGESTYICMDVTLVLYVLKNKTNEFYLHYQNLKSVLVKLYIECFSVWTSFSIKVGKIVKNTHPVNPLKFDISPYKSFYCKCTSTILFYCKNHHSTCLTKSVCYHWCRAPHAKLAESIVSRCLIRLILHVSSNFFLHKAKLRATTFKLSSITLFVESQKISVKIIPLEVFLVLVQITLTFHKYTKTYWFS